jgi:hypothetical protein
LPTLGADKDAPNLQLTSGYNHHVEDSWYSRTPGLSFLG